MDMQIIIDGKTYQEINPEDKCSVIYQIHNWINGGRLEEVKENKPEIELLPEFDYEKLEENIRDVEFERIDECRHMIGHIGKQLELLTKTLNQVISKIN